MPSTLLERLNLDHQRLDRVLDVIDDAAGHIESQSNGEALDHLEAALSYVAEYPDAIHHPLEEQAYARLLAGELSEDDRAAVAEVQAQHHSLIAQTRTVAAQLPGLAARSVQSKHELAEQLQAYTQAQRAHMSFEQHHVFPLFAKVLSSVALRELDAAQVPQDPLFDAQAGRFEAIFDYAVARGDYQGGRPADTSASRLRGPMDAYLGARQLASGASYLFEVAEKVGAIQLEQWRLAATDHADTLAALLSGKAHPAEIWTDHVARRMTHLGEGWRQVAQVWRSEISRATRASQRLWLDPIPDEPRASSDQRDAP